MNKITKIILLFSIMLFLGLWFSSQAVRSDQKVRAENLTFSQFKSMLTPQGKKELGSIYTSVEAPKSNVPSILSFIGYDNNFVLQITPKRITGRYMKPGIRIDKSDDRERVLDRTLLFNVESLPSLINEDLLKKLDSNRIAYKFINEEDGFFSSIIGALPLVVIVLLVWMFMMRQLQGTGNRALSFGKSKARLTQAEDKKNKVTFKDIAGCDEAKQELVEVVEFLKSPKRFQNIGAKIPRGVLLVGPPGTGKTLLARAIAGEAGVPFYSISGSDFVEMFVGVGASRVRDLFFQAKKSAPCIIFVDEIDAVGRLRGAGLGGGHDEREQTLNQLLVEMDGFEENEGVIIIAATNRPDVLDPALLRPGRFDRQVVVDLPDVRGREAILRIHARKVSIVQDLNLEKIARGTSGFTGADLANLINEAALIAARRELKKVGESEIEDARDKVLMGPERRSFLINPKEKEVIAYHEGGHTLLTLLLPNTEPIHKVTIIPRGRALGITQSLPEEDKHIHPKKYWEDKICLTMGGFLAEEIVYKDTSTGAANDIQVATKIARRMVCEWGMSSALGTVAYVNENDNVFLGREMGHSVKYSDDTAANIDKEIRRIVLEQLNRGRELLISNKEKLDKIAQILLAEECVSAQRLKEEIFPERIVKEENTQSHEKTIVKDFDIKSDLDPTPAAI